MLLFGFFAGSSTPLVFDFLILQCGQLFDSKNQRIINEHQCGNSFTKAHNFEIEDMARTMKDN